MKEDNSIKTKIQKLEGFEVFVDAEWNGDNTPVSVQVNIIHPNGFDGKFIVINSIYKPLLDLGLIERWQKVNGAEVVFYELGDSFNVIHNLLKDFYFKKHSLPENSNYYFNGEVFIFYSFQDLGRPSSSYFDLIWIFRDLYNVNLL